MTERLRLRAVSFLNTEPLVYDLTHPRPDRPAAPFDLSFEVPSACAERLERGEADVALVPVAAYAAHPEWEVVPEVAIACRGPAETVVVASEVPFEDVERIVLDDASRTSVALLRVLLDAWGRRVDLEPGRHGDNVGRIGGRTAALVIGDAAFGLAERFPHVLDLGEAWFRETGLPMVFAFWAARPGALAPEHVEALIASRDRGLKHAEAIARAYRTRRLESGAPALSENAYANYLRKRMRYDLGAFEREGLVEFLSRARAAGVLDVPGLCDDDVVHVRFAGRGEHAALAAARKRRRAPMDVDALLDRAASGGRLDLAEGIFLYEEADLMDLGVAADARRAALHPEGIVTYIVDRNVNYTNVCTARCKFCNFYTPPGGPNPYVLDRDTLRRKFEETRRLGGVQILLQGGLNPELGLAWYEDFFRWTREEFPDLNMHALSPTEIIHIARMEDMTVREVLERLIAAGLGSLPGGGAEILHDAVRDRISPFKNTTQEWLDVMREAHRLGLSSSCSMVYGFQETAEQILLHLERLRALQDETGGFIAFIVWPFQAEGTRLKLRDDTSAHRYLRIQALARLYLDNVPNLQVSWPTLGPAVGEVGLRFGANDFGSVMIEENVVSKAGAHFMLSAEEIERHIRNAGFRPARRNQRYELLTAPEPPPAAEPPRATVR